MNEPAKQSRLTPVKKFVKRNERRILIATTVVSTTYSVVLRAGIAQHNVFLKEHGLYEQFYDLTPEA